MITKNPVLWLIYPLLMAAAILPAAAQTSANSPGSGGKFSDDQEKLAYAIGVNTAMNLIPTLNRIELDVDTNAIMKGFADQLAGHATLTIDEESNILTKFEHGLEDVLAAKHQKEGDAFRAKYKAEPGVTVTASGLMYKVLTNGTGPVPTTNDTVNFDYSGGLVDGKEFDSSAKHGKAVEVPVTHLIPGWSQALLMMPAGSTWELVVPPELAYGIHGRPPVIGPKETLVFQVTLHDFHPTAIDNAASPASSIVKVPSIDEYNKGAQPEMISAEEARKMQLTNAINK